LAFSNKHPSLLNAHIPVLKHSCPLKYTHT